MTPMNLGSCDHCGKLMEIADCIQYKDGKFFCSHKCADEYRPGINRKDFYQDNQPQPLPEEVHIDY